MIVGTAGHIDHGKTTLVKALTGSNADRLPEEKRRGISLELGFAFMDGPDGSRIGFVDVPGHERLVNTMVSGATGIDFAMLLVAADDGIMPQTQEHLAVLSLLGITKGVVVITKSDRSDEASLLDLKDKIKIMISGTSLEGSDVVTVSAYSGYGVQELKQQLYIAAADHNKNRNLYDEQSGFRLAIDRVFSIDGAGTTITGTVHAGTVTIGQELLLVPGDEICRVRSIHAQNQAVDSAHEGQRCALVVSRLARSDINRGQWLVHSLLGHSTQRIDTHLTVWQGEERSLKTGTKVHFHMGSGSAFGTVAVLDGNTLAPGESGVVQIVLQKPIGAWWGDRLILRDASGARTIAGGMVLDADAPARYRRSEQRLQSLKALYSEQALSRLAGLLESQDSGVNLKLFKQVNGLVQANLPENILHFKDADNEWVISTKHANSIQQKVLNTLNEFHVRNPDQLGPDPARLRRLAAPRLNHGLWHLVLQDLVDTKRVTLRGSFVHSPDHGASLSEVDQRIQTLVMPYMLQNRFAGSWVRDLANQCDVSEEQMRTSLARLARQGGLHQIVKDLYYPPEVIYELAFIARGICSDNNGDVTAAQFRDAVGLGRKRAIQILEYFDRVGVMRRIGNTHRLRTDSSLFEVS